jgi:hypothetical protein
MNADISASVQAVVAIVVLFVPTLCVVVVGLPPSATLEAIIVPVTVPVSLEPTRVPDVGSVTEVLAVAVKLIV